MSYQERRAIVSLIASVVITVLYFVYALQRYPEGDPYSPEVFHFWGASVLILIPVAIAARIVVYILFSIFNTVATREAEPSVTDERDRMIELKANRNSLYVFSIGFLLAMVTLVLNQPPTVMFVVLIGAGMASDAMGELSQFFFYRRGY